MNLGVAGDFVLDNKSALKPAFKRYQHHKRASGMHVYDADMTLIMLLRYCRPSTNSHHSYGFLISHKSPQNDQSESKLNSVAVSTRHLCSINTQSLFLLLWGL